ncbi:hypothetical protein [Nocardioides sp.]|uniref:hypothetical protein n=1 Tax=Nocardioides sp. TaxID=35761 RepID=UPI0035665D03
MTSDVDAYLQLLLQLARTAGYAAVAVYCFSRLSTGAWARLGALGGATAGTISAVYALSLVQVLMAQSHAVHEFLHQHRLALVLDLAMTVGILIALTAVVADRTGSPIGSRLPSSQDA